MKEYDYLQNEVRKYIEDLSKRTIAPGGGSAAALTACLGVSLNLMVINYSVKDEEEASHNKELVVLKQKQNESLVKLSKAVDEDCMAFSELMDSLKKKKGTEDKYTYAASVPMDICRECCDSLEVTSFLVEEANENLVSDVACAAHLIKAAFLSASVNVYVNLKYINDREFVKTTGETLFNMEKKITNTEKEILERIDRQIRNKKDES